MWRSDFDISWGFAYTVHTVGRYTYLTNQDSLRIVDVATPSAPVARGFYDSPGKAMSVTANGSLALVADVDDDLWIMDVSQPVLTVTAEQCGCGRREHDPKHTVERQPGLCGGRSWRIEHPRSCHLLAPVTRWL